MALPGNEIHRQYDEQGVVQVFDDGEKRYLAFGTDTEQSCVLKRNAADLQYEYTRAMLLPLLFQPQPKRALILGLGAGSLATCLNRHCRQLKITAVELRPAVIDVAYRFFQLPIGKKLKVVADNADDFLRQQPPGKHHLIFSDIYGADDVDTLQLQERYLDQCQQHLHSEGWLVLNCWRHHQRDSELLELLQSRFQQLAFCNTQAGNWILMASNQTQLPNRSRLKDSANDWARQLGFSLPLSRLEFATQS